MKDPLTNLRPKTCFMPISNQFECRCKMPRERLTNYADDIFVS